jgi:hypothetical protein
MLVAGMPPETREQLDGDLGVAAWPTPSIDRERPALPPSDEDRDPAAPAWYHGDEAESQAFLRAVGVTLE